MIDLGQYDAMRSSPTPEVDQGVFDRFREKLKALDPQKVREAVLDQVFESCLNDPGYLENLIEWAHRDYSEADYLKDYLAMQPMHDTKGEA